MSLAIGQLCMYPLGIYPDWKQHHPILYCQRALKSKCENNRSSGNKWSLDFNSWVWFIMLKSCNFQCHKFSAGRVRCAIILRHHCAPDLHVGPSDSVLLQQSPVWDHIIMFSSSVFQIFLNRSYVCPICRFHVNLPPLGDVWAKQLPVAVLKCSPALLICLIPC